MKRFTPACPALLRACLVAFAGAVTHSSPGADHKEPITHEALWLMKQVGAPAPSPDGRWVIVPVTEPAYDEKDEVSDLWMVPGDGSAPPRRLTTAKGKESSPAWSPDGTRVAFSAKREGDEVAQLYLLALAGGEARRITELTLGAREPRWSPDGSRIAFLGPVSRGATNEAANKQLAEDRKKAKSKVRIYDGFPIRRWDKWLDDTQTHLFVMPADGSGPPRDWLAGSRLAAGAGFRGVGEEGSIDTLQPEWAPDGRSLVFTATTNFDHAAYDQPVFSLYQVSLDDAEPR